MTTVRDIDWSLWTPHEVATLLYVVRDGQVLMIEKKRGLGAGKINGPGGRVHPRETPLAAAVRETEEELEVTPLGARRAGEVLFHVLDGASIHIHVFRADGLSGNPVETQEARPVWVRADAVPFDRMWEDDRYWFPHLLAGRWFSARTVFRGDELLSYEIVTPES